MKTTTLLPFVTLYHPSQAITLGNAESAFNTLQSYYNTSIGLWIPSTGWWNSANCLTTIADLAVLSPTVAAEAEHDIYQNTFVRAQQYNLQEQKEVGPNWMPWTYNGHHWPFFPKHWHHWPRPHKANGFLNDYYDDEGWWALAWIAVYDNTGDEQYLRTAESIFDDIAEAYDTTPCGGVWWDRNNTYVNAIANELFLDVAAHLANRAGGGGLGGYHGNGGSSSKHDKAYYLDWAQKEWTWFQASGMINDQNLINDGLDNATCENNGGTVWSYNQGVVLGGLAELSRATGDESYIATAKLIADAAIANLTDAEGILHDVCEPDCGGDGAQFKGVFARNLRILQEASPEERYADFLLENADSIWANDRSNGAELSVVWSG